MTLKTYSTRPVVCAACCKQIDHLVAVGAADHCQQYCYGCNAYLRKEVFTAFHPTSGQPMRFHDATCAQKWFRAAIKELATKETT